MEDRKENQNEVKDTIQTKEEMEEILKKRIQFIVANMDVNELLLGLAEECSELAQAALKLRRVFTRKNPTSDKEDEAINNLYEECADVFLYMKTLKFNEIYIEKIMIDKANRWITRLSNIRTIGNVEQ